MPNNKPISFKANITKVTRQSGKPFAQIVINIPVQASADMPMGDVKITVEPAQKSML